MNLNYFTPRRLKLALIALPMLLAAIYFGLIAADRFVSESTVALRQAGNDSTAIPGAALLLAGLSPPSRDDTFYLRQYMQSLALLQRLDAKLKIREHYEKERLDIAFRLWSFSSQESFLDYFRTRVEIILDDTSATLTVRAQGFKAEFAQQLNKAILEEGEEFVNEMSHKLAREKLDFSQAELTRAGDKLQAVKSEVLAFQAKNKLLDATVQAQASGALTAEMQASITKSEADLLQLRSYLNDDTYQVRTLRQQIDAMRTQLDVERSRATGSGKQSDRLGSLAIEFQGLQMKAEFALDGYKIALAAVESSRIEASRKLKSLVVIEPPTLPQTAELPRRIYNLLTILIVCMLVYGVVRLVIATIREHKD